MTLRTLVLTGVAALSLSAAAVAAGPSFWTIASAADLLRGTSDGVYVDLNGVVTPGPQLANRLTSTPPQVWSLAASADGTLWAGAGGDGRLLRLRPGQPEETAATAPEGGVFAVAVSGTRVFFASSPDGRVYVIDGAAAARPFFDPPEKYIWALAVDGSGRLWVGAGSPAVIYRVDAAGNGQAVYHPPAAHVVSLLLDATGRMLAGTESPGRLYRFDANDRPYVLLDSGLTELRGIVNGPNGAVFAAATGRGDDASATSSDAASSIVAATPAALAPGQAIVTTASSASGGHRSTIYRVDADGTWESFWETSDVIYDLASSGDGGVFAASGPDGRLYKIPRSQQAQLMSGVDAKQITRLLAAPNGSLLAFATANPGRVMAVGRALQSPASYLSPVRDTKSSSTWGTIRWDATGQVTLYSRSGNTDTPDDSWSDWAGPYTHRDGDSVKSVPARFLQWKAVLQGGPTDPAPSLTSVTVAYLTRNTRPVVSSVVTTPPGVVFQRPFGGDDAAIAGLDDASTEARRPAGDTTQPPAPGRRMYQKGLQTISWKADDADGDRLIYTLAYRREGASDWKPLKANVTDTIFVWDTTTVPDGRYVVRVLASDVLSNPDDRALSGERESDPIEVDNTPPVMTVDVTRQTNRIHVLVHVRDAESPIEKLEFSYDGNRWQVAYPVDGLADSPDEHYDLSVPGDAELSRMVLRATDALQNVTTQAAPFR